ncbi:MAG: YicC family protein [Chlamydiales bacterium]|nr:YicC family protein [Chlamydiales bacterium]
MVRSMTAYGRATKDNPLGSWAVEIHSVNRKMLDMHLMMPKEFLRFDLDVRKWIADQIQRGQVNVRIVHTLNEKSIAPSIKTLKQFKGMWEKVAEELGYDPLAEVDLPFLLDRAPQSSTLEQPEQDEELKASLKDAVGSALKEMMEMKVREGKHLHDDLLGRLKIIEDAAQKAKLAAPQMMDNFRKKLLERISSLSLLPQTPENEERLFRELSFFAEKGDVTEELTRLDSHIAQFRHYLKSGEKSIGRTLDFLTQEIHREINTLSAKSLETELSYLTVLMKSECEKIREQLQNIE